MVVAEILIVNFNLGYQQIGSNGRGFYCYNQPVKMPPEEYQNQNPPSAPPPGGPDTERKQPLTVLLTVVVILMALTALGWFLKDYLNRPATESRLSAEEKARILRALPSPDGGATYTDEEKAAILDRLPSPDDVSYTDEEKARILENL